MLRRLLIRDFVIVQELELEFAAGMTVLTGETGAGKSILIDALMLTLGERADSIAVRQGAARADVLAEFDINDQPILSRWLLAHDLDGDDGVCMLRRVIDANGRSRGMINGHPVTAAQLREAGQWLVDIHGQHQHQSLSRPAVQRALLDAYAGQDVLTAEVDQAWQVWQQHCEARRALADNSAAMDAERERLRWQLQDLETLKVLPGEWSQISAEHSRLAHAASLIDATQVSIEALAEGEGALLNQLSSVITRLQSLLVHDPQLSEMIDALQSALIYMQEGSHGLRRYSERSELDPQRLRDVEVRLEALYAVARKYRVEVEALPVIEQQARTRLEELTSIGDLEQLLVQESAAEAVYQQRALKLSAARQRAAKQLAAAVTAAMQDLAMQGGVFEVVLLPVSPAAYGLEQIEFRVSPHVSVEAQSMARTASGGELSRLSLAIQTVLSQVARVPTLVFDEVDVGIGGRVAEIVGQMLRRLGAQHQVMCITHLPQVAAAANQQWQVSKTTVAGQVSSQVSILDAEGRVGEIARMLGGVTITDTTRKHAVEMLVQAQSATVFVAPVTILGKKSKKSKKSIKS